MLQRPATWYLQEYDRLLEDFIDTFADFSKVAFNTPYLDGKWSPGQMVEHLVKSEAGILRFLENTPSAPPPADRGYDDKCIAIDADFRLTVRQLPSPKALLPTPELTFSPSDLLDTFVDQRADIRSAFDFANDIGTLIEVYGHPLFGTMTICEWTYFTAIHGERHRLQVSQTPS